MQPVDGPRRAAFFFPHHNESGYWWQGENARLASLAAAAPPGCPQGALPGEGPLAARLGVYAADQLGWILGCNPFDACFLHGFGRNNPEYETGFPNAFGGICNGVTGGFRDEEDIDFLPSPYAEQRGAPLALERAVAAPRGLVPAGRLLRECWQDANS